MESSLLGIEARQAAQRQRELKFRYYPNVRSSYPRSAGVPNRYPGATSPTTGNNANGVVPPRSVMGLGLVLNRRLPPSSRNHESGVWQGLYRLEVEVISDSTRCNGKIGRCNGRKTRSCKRDYSDVSTNYSSSVIWKITREYLNL
jgi:hypothetical protein